MKRTIFALATALAATMLVQQGIAQTNDYPNRPVRVIVPYPPAGGIDIAVRIVMQKVSENWGQSIVIENCPGGNSAIGATMASKAPADGYTLLAVMDTTMVMNPAVSKNLTYNPLTDFTAISMIAKNALVLTVRSSDNVKTVKELIAKARAAPGKLNYGTATVTTRLAGYLFAKTAAIETTNIPFKGSSEVVNALLAGTIDYAVDGLAAHLSQIQSDNFRALAKLDSRPVVGLADLPRLATEGDIPAMEDISVWIGLVAPTGTPPGIVKRLEEEVTKVLNDPGTVQRMRSAGVNPLSIRAEEFDTFYRREAKFWAEKIAESGLKFE